MKKIHYFSGLILTVFIGLHLFNHICGIFGAASHIAVMQSLRLVYRNIFCETILLCAVFIQISSGIGLLRNKRTNLQTFFDRLHFRTGIYLSFFLLVHVSVVLAGRFYLHLDTNFYFGAAGLNTFPHNLFFIPYYGLAILSFFGHIAAVHRLKMKRPVLGISPLAQSRCILAAGILCLFIVLYAATGHFKGTAIPARYNVLLGKSYTISPG